MKKTEYYLALVRVNVANYDNPSKILTANEIGTQLAKILKDPNQSVDGSVLMVVQE